MTVEKVGGNNPKNHPEQLENNMLIQVFFIAVKAIDHSPLLNLTLDFVPITEPNVAYPHLIVQILVYPKCLGIKLLPNLT